VSAREEQLEAALAEARAERARLWEEVQRLRAERREVEYYEQLAVYMQGSASWKLTSPLRTAKRVTIRVRRELEERRG
jgi:hypothetical protein